MYSINAGVCTDPAVAISASACWARCPNGPIAIVASFNFVPNSASVFMLLSTAACTSALLCIFCSSVSCCFLFLPVRSETLSSSSASPPAAI